MLIEAARRTEGILAEPKPARFSRRHSRTTTRSTAWWLRLHRVSRGPVQRCCRRCNAHIQDVFNEYGVQIMSPHYIADPQNAKWVPKENWYAEPARREPPGV